MINKFRKLPQLKNQDLKFNSIMFKFNVKYLIKFSIVLLFLCGQLQSFAQKDKNVDAIKAVMKKQSEDWNKGDIDAFMEGYWQSDELQFIGSRGPTYGWQKTLDNYKKSYPDKSAMGILSFDITNIDRRSKRVYSMIGSWKLTRTNDELGGYFLLIWKKIKGKWLIVSDHTN